MSKEEWLGVAKWMMWCTGTVLCWFCVVILIEIMIKSAQGIS